MALSRKIAISCVMASSVTVVLGMFPPMASTSLSAARSKATSGVIVGIVRYLCLKNTVSQTLRCRDVDLMASVMFVRVADVVAAHCVRCPRLADSGVKVGLDPAAKGCKWMGVVIVGAPEVGVC